VLERAGDRDAGAFGAVDAAEDEHARPLRIADADRVDRTAVLGTAEHQPPGT
jgi:hypothetical protein